MNSSGSLISSLNRPFSFPRSAATTVFGTSLKISLKTFSFPLVNIGLTRSYPLCFVMVKLRVCQLFELPVKHTLTFFVPMLDLLSLRLLLFISPRRGLARQGRLWRRPIHPHRPEDGFFAELSFD